MEPRYNYMSISFTDELRDLVAAGNIDYKNKENYAMSHEYSMPLSGEDRIEQMEHILREEREKVKAAKKAAAKAAATARERTRLRKVALQSLEHVAVHGHGEARVQAAVELLKAVGK